MMELAIESGADDVVVNDDQSMDVITTPAAFGTVVDAIEAAGMTPDHAEVSMVPEVSTTLDLEAAQKVMKLVDVLEDLDDVQKVSTNADIPNEVMAQLYE